VTLPAGGVIMNTTQINSILRRNPVTRQIYRGCFPSDMIPSFRRFPSAMVVNFDPHTQGGTHWVAIYAPDKLHAFYFDSTASDGVDSIEEYLRKNFKITVLQNVALQKPGTTVCGYYAIYFIFRSALGYTIDEIQEQLEKSKNPDIFVSRYVQKHVIKN
jgi:hypothetical protein